ncbi:MAG TPA: Hsp70 family protein [Kofleriaceae bacterium]|nr:Hsp70 family protein [Kofleriaceae bacterium]
MRLGIDFGTTRTVVAAVLDGRHPLAAFDTGGEFTEHVPGLAALCGGRLRVGWDAARAIASGEAEHAIRSIKRVAAALAPDDPVPGLPGTTALELCTAFLAEVRRNLVESSNLDVHGPLEAMLAVPASTPSRQRWLTLEAARRAGFTPLGLLNEPTAASIEYAHRYLGALGKRSPKRYVVIYDLGGGTFDASAVSLEDRRFDLIASDGVARLGGDDFDELILAAACETAGTSPPPAARAAALERVREAKESLRPTSRRFLVELEGAPVTLDVGAIYARCQPLIDETLVHTERLFERLRLRGIDPDDVRELGGVYLVGGAAAFPAVARSLRARFGRKLQLAPQPFAATAAGLAIAADPDADVRVREAVTRHFGVWREGEGGADKVFDRLIDKDTAADGPLVVRRRYRPTHSVGHLRFLECGTLDEAGQPIDDLVPAADVYFPYDPSLADRAELARAPVEHRPDLLAEEISETYTYAPDGTIEICIENLTHGYARRFALGAPRAPLLRG